MTGLVSYQGHNQALFDLYIYPLFDLGEQALRTRPDPRLNSIVWNLWHIARAEDVGVSRLLAGGQQLLDREDWNRRMNLDIRHIGTGMDKAEVDDLNARVDLPGVRAYMQAVHDQTQAMLAALDPSLLEQPLNPGVLGEALLDGETLHPSGRFVYDVYLNQPRDWLVMHVALNHPWYHLGEIMAIRTLLG